MRKLSYVQPTKPDLTFKLECPLCAKSGPIGYVSPVEFERKPGLASSTEPLLPNLRVGARPWERYDERYSSRRHPLLSGPPTRRE